MPQNAHARTAITAALWVAWGLLGAFAVGGWQASVWQRSAPTTLLPSSALDRQPALPASTAPAERAATTTASQGPAWRNLKASEQTALAPLEKQWAGLSGSQKRRWLALAQNFATLPEPEQQKLHSRMAEWASLSSQQRNQARLNYANTHRLGSEQKRAQWEAYQALSAKERQELAAKGANKPLGAAPALRPVAPKKLVQIPAARQSDPRQANPPKILPPETDKAMRTPAPPDPSTTSAAPASPQVETSPVIVPSATPQPLPLLPAGSEDSARPTPTDPLLPSH